MKKEVEKKDGELRKYIGFFFAILDGLGILSGMLNGIKWLFAWSYIFLYGFLGVIILVFIYNASICIKNYYKEKSKLVKVDATDIEKMQYFYNVASLRKHYIKEQLLDVVMKKIGVGVGIFAFLLLGSYLFCGESVKAFHSDFKTLIGIDASGKGEDKAKENKVGEELKIPEDKNGEGQGTDKKETNEQETKIRNLNWRFVLRNQDGFKFRDYEREQQVFFNWSDSEISWEDYVVGCMNNICSENKKGVNYESIHDDEGNDYFTYTECEDTFKNMVENAAGYVDYNEWLEAAPDYRDLEHYILGREHLNKIKSGKEQGCYELWNKLANDYQYYAQEYERQTDNEEAVRYYYINSIYCCMQGLKYSISQEEKDELYHYMVMRYHDMADEQSKVLVEDRKRASKIYSLLVKSDKLRKED